jgi:glycine cleavage system aminomethyltransferase T
MFTPYGVEALNVLRIEKGLSYTKGGICVNRMPREGSQL